MRGTGTTTQQLKAAPPGSLFIYCTRQVEYPKDLLKKMGRTDVTIQGVGVLDELYMSAQRYTAIIVDHAVVSTPERHAMLVSLMRHACVSPNDSLMELHTMIANYLPKEPA